jgi:Ca2+-binding RTX toxin-like protein
MATLDAGLNSTDLSMFNTNDVDHKAQTTPHDASQYSWTTSSGLTITAYSFADDIKFNATAPTAGTVHALEALGVYTVGGMLGDLVTMTKAPNDEAYWRAILDSATTIFASPNAEMRMAGDFVTVASGESKTGAADSFIGVESASADTQNFDGDADFVQQTASLIGGKDTITMKADGVVVGDADSVQGKLTGGADTITVDSLKIVDAGTRIVGDALSITDLEAAVAPIVIGGDDTITIKNFGGSGGISGDIFFTFASKGTTTGGNDKIDASADSGFLEASGDVAQLSNGVVRGGKDVMIASATGNAQFGGDAGEITGGQLQAGADTLIGGAGGDTLMGEVVQSSGGTVIINATFTGDDSIFGGNGDDFINGQVGDDIVDGGLGSDNMFGGSNTAGVGDIASFATENVGVSADLNLGFAFGQGNDTLDGFESLRGSNHQDSLGGNAKANRIEGLDGNDQIIGRGGADTLLGGKGDDAIFGLSGNDKIAGSFGADTLKGGLNNDIFDYDSVSDSTGGPATHDLISDFAQGADKVDLSTIDAKISVAGNQAFKFIGAAAFSAEGQVRATSAGGVTTIEVNNSGTTGAEMTIDLTGTFTLLAGDFIL